MPELPPRPSDVRLDRRRFLRAVGAMAGGLGLASAGSACDVREYARAHGAKLRLSIATGPIGGTYYVYGGGLASVISRHLPNVEATAELTGASVDNLKFLRLGRADLALVAGTTLYEAYSGTESFRELGRVPVRALAVLYVQPLHLVTFAEQRIGSLTDLRGKVVSRISSGLTRTLVAPTPSCHCTVPVSTYCTRSSLPISCGVVRVFRYASELVRAITRSPARPVSCPRTSSTTPSVK